LNGFAFLHTGQSMQNFELITFLNNACHDGKLFQWSCFGRELKINGVNKFGFNADQENERGGPPVVRRPALPCGEGGGISRSRPGGDR
jgi:hypothetical protein